MVEVRKDEIFAHLDRITASTAFSSSPRLIEFLRFCVEKSVKGEADEIKESTIGVNVFGRAPDYDTQTDPIVRVHARRLRDKLQAFYQAEGRHEVFEVEIRKGGYIPHILWRTSNTPAPSVPKPDIRSWTPQPLPAPAPIATPSISPASAAKSLPPFRQGTFAAGTAAVFTLLACGITLLIHHFTGQSSSATTVYATSSSPRPGTTSEALPLVALAGSERDPAWSPDGKSIAFAWTNDSDNRSRVYTLNPESGTPVPLTAGSQPEYRPVWSPDGKSIAFLRYAGAANYQVVIVNLNDRSERILHTQPYAPSYSIEMPALDWSRDGRWIVTNEQRASSPAHLLLIDTGDGHGTQITDPPNGTTGDLEAKFSRDGQRLAFRRGGRGDVWMLSLNAGRASDARPLTRDNPGVRGLCWSADGSAIYFGGSREEAQSSIWRLPVDGGSPDRVTPVGMEAVSPALGADGRLAFVHPMGVVKLWRYGTSTPGSPEALSLSTRAEYSPAFSSDGKQVAFISDRSGPTEVWVASSDGSQARKVTSLGGAGLPLSPSWSVDGSRISFFCRKAGLNYAIEVPASGGPQKVLESGPSWTLEPQYSHDGKSFYYASNRGGRIRIWRKSLNGSSDAAEVTSEDSMWFRLSRDGRSLYFVRQGPPMELVEQDLGTNTQRVIWTWQNPISAANGWDVAGKNLFFVSETATSSNGKLMHANLVDKRQVALGTVKTNPWQSGIAATADGRGVLVSKVDRDESNVMYLNLQPAENTHK